jgi:hypothetical protein
VASSVAIRRASGWRRISEADAVIPYRASSASRRGGTSASMPSLPSPRALISATWSRYFTTDWPLPRGAGPLRHRSRSDSRAPWGTSGRRSSARRWTGPGSAASSSHIRRVDSSRTLATSRASVVTPGSSTFRSRSHASPSVKIAFGPSPVARDRAATHPENSASASANSR